MTIPEIDVDLWSDDVLVDPYPTYARLRRLGPVLYTAQWDAYVLPGYDEVRHALQDWETFSSASGVGLNDRANTMSGRGILTTDPPLHVLFGSANRDERRFADPDRFDIRRNPHDHLSFGRGVHRCVGANLAQEEIKAVLSALADRVERFDVVDRQWRRNNALHGLERLRVEAARV